MLISFAYIAEVKFEKGLIFGSRRTTIFGGRLYNAYYEVPYARSPVKSLRFKNPKSTKKWRKPYDAREEYHGACAQAHIVHKEAFYGAEDCLYLNIYTPSLSMEGNKLRSVVVWYHGFQHTTSFSHIYGPDFFIDNDVVFVSAAYRLGVFGFMKLNATDENVNMGLKDISLSLKWIKKYIKNFGGNPKSITVMGSGSAADLLSLLLLTKARKLFSKMILHSGSPFSTSMLQSNSNHENDVLTKALKNISNKNVTQSSSKDVVSATRKIYNSKDVINSQRPLKPFTPIIEEVRNKSLVTETPDKFYKRPKLSNKQSKIPILIGFSSQEGLSEMIPFLNNNKLLLKFQTFFRFMVPFQDGCKYDYNSKTYSKIASDIKSYYFSKGISVNSTKDFVIYVSDLQKYPIYKFVRSHISAGNEMYVYKFNYNGKLNSMKSNSLGLSKMRIKGAASGDELCYIMTCEPHGDMYYKLQNETDNKDRIFIEEMSLLWANFAKFSNPTPVDYRGLTWPKMTEQNYKMLYIGKKNKVIDTRVEDKMYKFWNTIYDNYYHTDKCRELYVEKDEL